MVEALWSVEFIVPQNRDYGAGVVVLENGTVRGGDSSYYYVGNFRIKDSVINAEVSVHHYFGQVNNVFGPLKTVNLSLEGGVAYDQFEVRGVAKEVPGAHIFIRFKRLAELSA